MIPVIEDKIRLRSRRDVLRLFLYTKLVERGIDFSGSELDVLMELYNIGGYENIDTEKEFFNACIEKKFRRSWQSVRNVLTRFVNLGVVKKPRIHQRSVSSDFLPVVESPILGLMFFVSNAA